MSNNDTPGDFFNGKTPEENYPLDENPHTHPGTEEFPPVDETMEYELEDNRTGAEILYEFQQERLDRFEPNSVFYGEGDDKWVTFNTYSELFYELKNAYDFSGEQQRLIDDLEIAKSQLEEANDELRKENQNLERINNGRQNRIDANNEEAAAERELEERRNKRNKIIAIVGATIGVIALIAAITFLFNWQSAKSDLEEQSSRTTNSQSTNKEIQSSLEEARNERDSAKSNAEEMQKKLSNTEKKLKEANQKNTDGDKLIKERDDYIKELEDEIDSIDKQEDKTVTKTVVRQEEGDTQTVTETATATVTETAAAEAVPPANDGGATEDTNTADTAVAE